MSGGCGDPACDICHPKGSSDEWSEGIARTAVWLDGKYPGWADAIDLDDLDMDSSYYCIAGQMARAAGRNPSGAWVDLNREAQDDLSEKYVEGCFLSRAMEPAWREEVARRKTPIPA